MRRRLQWAEEVWAEPERWGLRGHAAEVGGKEGGREKDGGIEEWREERDRVWERSYIQCVERREVVKLTSLCVCCALLTWSTMYLAQ